jgi:hypothetical protein
VFNVFPNILCVHRLFLAIYAIFTWSIKSVKEGFYCILLLWSGNFNLLCPVVTLDSCHPNKSVGLMQLLHIHYSLVNCVCNKHSAVFNSAASVYCWTLFLNAAYPQKQSTNVKSTKIQHWDKDCENQWCYTSQFLQICWKRLMYVYNRVGNTFNV